MFAQALATVFDDMIDVFEAHPHVVGIKPWFESNYITRL
jgi:hypothetical protein